MDSLRIEQTEDSPFVNFDLTTNTFIISGESRPEHAGKFYAPVIKWISEFEAEAKNRNVVFVFKLDYFNSTSAKYIMDIILTIKTLIDKGGNVSIQWHSDKRDDDMVEAGQEFADTANVKFEFVQY